MKTGMRGAWAVAALLFASFCAWGQRAPEDLANVTAKAYPGADAVIVRD